MNGKKMTKREILTDLNTVLGRTYEKLVKSEEELEKLEYAFTVLGHGNGGQIIRRLRYEIQQSKTDVNWALKMVKEEGLALLKVKSKSKKT